MNELHTHLNIAINLIQDNTMKNDLIGLTHITLCILTVAMITIPSSLSMTH